MFGKSLKLGDVLGIRVQVHWTFILLLGWVLVSGLISSGDIAASLLQTSFLIVLFACVTLHEFGHALAARMYGISTRDITLLPIGGVARLESMPKNPLHEIVVALAGPAVNVAIAVVLWALVGPISGSDSWLAIAMGQAGFWQRVLFVNIMLVAFNLLPAFPMDGGRVLRGTLAVFLDYLPATRIAAAVGQTCAVGFGVLGLFGNPMLILLAAFIYLGAAAEARNVQLQRRLRGWKVADAANRHFRVVSANASAATTAMEVLHQPQRAFPIVDEGNFIGMVSRKELIRGLHLAPNVTIADLPRTQPIGVEPNDSLETSFQTAVAAGHDLLPVVTAGELVGLLDLRNVVEIISAQSQFRKLPPQPMISFRPLQPN